jgi:phospholipid/cholesterol/gamma-HCH transport system substrate-binding protein
MSGTGRRGGFNPLIAGFMAGVAMALVLGLLAKINVDFAAPWSKTHTMTAQVSDVDGISAGSDVRIAGRPVGQITSVDARGTYSTVTFKVDDGDWPLAGDTSASIRLATLLGQKYLQLTPGKDTAHPYPDNGTIALRATQPVVDFDQILNTFDKPTRDSLTSLIRTAASAVQGQEGTLQQLIPDLRDLSVHSVSPTQELAKRNPEINNILVNLGTTADTLNQSSNNLAGVIDNMNNITGTLAHNQGALEGYIANVDAINQTTDAVLKSGRAAEFGAGLQQLGSFTTLLNKLMTDLVPETGHFASDRSKATGLPIWQDAKNLVFQIGAATAQGNKSGYMLRQNANGVDPCGLLGPTCVATNAPPSAALPSTLPCLPGLPCPILPGLPTPPPLPTLPPVPTPPVPTPPVPTPPLPTLPLPTPHGSNPTPTPCLLPPLCGSSGSAATTSYDLSNVDMWGFLLVNWGSM